MDIFDKLKMETAIKDMWEVMDHQIKFYEVQSKMLREYYNALIKEGFTNEQALELVKNHGINGAVKKED